jgi:NCS1 family nucleobase:cation symporter-1
MAELVHELEKEFASDTGPKGSGDFHVETRGLDPVPANERYGNSTRLLSIFFFPNLNAGMFFAGALATASFIGLNFTWAVIAIVAGNIIACVPVGVLGVMGARTGLAQLPLARLPFGRSIVLPAVLNWGTNILWDGINCLFGAEAIQVLVGIPFWGALLIVIAAQTVLSFIGYEAIHTFGKWVSVVLAIVFIAITVKVAMHGSIDIKAQAHGAGAVGSFILFLSIVMSYTFTWAPYSSDYTRYLPKNTSSSAIVWKMTAGNVVSAIWLQMLGLVTASVITDQSSAGIYDFVGKGFFGAIAMIAIVLGNVGADALDDYSGALSLQAAGLRIPRPISAVIVAAGGFILALWLDHGSFETDLSNLLLFIGYWVAPFVGIVLVDWWMRRGQVDPMSVVRLRSLPTGWQAVVAVLAGFGLSVPFMDSSVYVGAVSSGPLHGGDIAYFVGGILAAVIYYALAKVTRSVTPAPAVRAAEPEAEAVA